MSKCSVQCSTLVDLLRWRSLYQPDQCAYTFLLDGETDRVSLTYEELDRQARAIGALLQSLGAEGKRALLLYPPGLEYIAGFFGCLYGGSVAVPAYPPDPARLNRTLPRLQAIVADAQATLVLTTAPILSMAALLFNQAPDLKALHWLATDDVFGDPPADDSKSSPHHPGQALADEWQGPSGSGDTLAFLQYTSGSTAAPRGVMLTHANLLHNSALISNCFGHTPDSRGVIWLPPYHDMGLIGGIIQPLYGGFPVMLMSPIDFLKMPFRWLQAVSRYEATTSGGPNFAYDLCVRKITPEQRATLDLSSWDLAFNGAEPVRHDTMERFAAAFASCGFCKEAFYPCYGLAEATLIASGGSKAEAPIVQAADTAALGQNRVETVALTHPNARTLVGCGHTLTDQRIVIADPDTFHQCPASRIGEIWISGPGVAQGYWNQPKSTAEAFQAYLADTGKGPFLRTGDLGFLWDGELFVTGRIKDLIIIRGRNHYPQDIERTVEQSHPALRPGCGAAFSVEVTGEERLVVAQEIRPQTTDLEEIIQTVRQAVAEAHELQVYGVLLLQARSIPKTSSGKIQRHACRAGFLSDSLNVVAKSILDQDVPPVEASSTQPGEVSFIRKALSTINEPSARHSLLTLYLQEQAARVLCLTPSQVDVERPLGTLGLDSLMAVELTHKVETDLGVILPIANFLQGPGIAQLSHDILVQLATSSPSPQATLSPTPEPQTEHPLSHGQQALWFLYQLSPESAAYNVPGVVRIRSELDVAALRQALQKLVARYPSLRTTFTVSPTSEGPVQCIHEQMDLDFEIIDTLDWSEESLDQRLAEDAHRPFDLEQGPLLRVRVFKRSDQEYVLLVMMHHIITDFWSLAVLVEQLSVLYPAECAGEQVALSPTHVQYTDYARWQTEMLAGPRGERLRAYWREQLSGELPVLDLPTDHTRPLVQTYNGSVHTVRLSAEITNQLKALSQARGVTLNATLLAAFQVLLHRYTGQQDFLVGSLAAGRTRAELAEIVGYFVNPIVLRAKPSPTQTFAAFLDQTRQTVLAAFEHQDYPFDVLVNELQPIRDYGRSPLFQVMFAFQRAYKFNQQGLTPFSLDITGAQMELAGLRLESLALEHRVAQFDLTLTMGEADGGLVVSYEYNTDLYETDTIARMATHLQALLEGVVADPYQRLAELPLLSESERQQLLVAWNGAQVDQPHDATIQALFEAQVARTPNALAVIFEDEQLTYRELDQRADQLAIYLRGLGVGPETLVGVYVEHSLEMIVGILGVLKAGGAYVPLDPTYPRERLAFTLAEAHLPVLLTQAHLQDSLPQHTARVVCLDTDWGAVAAGATGSAGSQGGDENLACAIYTSGSMGRPKAVLLENRSIVNLIHSFIRSYHPTTVDRILPLTSVASASFVGEILPLLCVGGTLVLARADEFLDLDKLFDLITRCGVSIVSTVPTVIAGLNEKQNDLPPLRLLLSGGEALAIGDIDTLLDSVSIVNSYGLTETTVCSTFYELDGRPARIGAGVPIGQPVINTEVYVLDSGLNCLPIGCPGELYVAGVGLARGYLGKPEWTADRFLPNPYKPGERMYRTGDLARWLPGGILEYLDRVDHQVKIRGFRIELDEIEATLKGHSTVRDTVVITREDTPGDKRLVAYVVPGEATLTSSDLHRWLADRVPSYMMPAAFEMLDALPLTPNGKVDVKALPAPEGIRPSLMTTYLAPRSELERAIATMWQVVLQVEKVGIQDNFFELGGNSMLAARVHRQLREELNGDLSLVEMFKYPTVGSLAQRLSQEQRETVSLQEVRDEAQRRKEALNRRKQLVKKRLGGQHIGKRSGNK